MEIVGVDVGKHKCVAAKECGGEFRRLEFENSAEGFHRLKAFCPAGAKVVLESTGHYGRGLIWHAKKTGLSVEMVNPFSFSTFARSINRDTKTDAVDAQGLVLFARINPEAFRVPEFSQIRPLTRLRIDLVGQKSRTRLKIHAIVDQLFPELGRIFKKLKGKAVICLLQTYPTPESVQKTTVEELGAFLRAHSKGKLGEEKAREILDAAKDSFGFPSHGLEVQLKLLLAQYEFLRSQIKTLDVEIAEQNTDNLLKTIPGMGDVLSAIVMAEIGDIKNFESSKQMRGYAGLRPRVHQSGEFRASQTSICKNGNRYLRTALFLAAVSAVKVEPRLKAYYQKKIDEGKKKKMALIAVASRLANISFAVLSTQKPFDPDALHTASSP